MLKELVDFIFPKNSIIAGNKLEENNSNQYFSDEEVSVLPRVSHQDLLELKEKTTSDFSFSMFSFREGDDFSKIIYQLKYGGMKRLGICLGRLLGRELEIFLNENEINPFDKVIPVPLFKTKVRERGYNQSDYLCMGMSNQLNIELIPDLVKRIRHTTTQTKLSREKRIANMKDAFEVNLKYKDQIEGLRIILVDDVITTGTTINEVTRVLKENNCGDILCCTLAMAR